MKKKVLENVLVEIVDLIKWNFEGDEKNEIVIKDMKKILKKYNVKKDVDKLYKEFEEKEGRGYI